MSREDLNDIREISTFQQYALPDRIEKYFRQYRKCSRKDHRRTQTMTGLNTKKTGSEKNRFFCKFFSRARLNKQVNLRICGCVQPCCSAAELNPVNNVGLFNSHDIHGHLACDKLNAAFFC